MAKQIAIIIILFFSYLTVYGQTENNTNWQKIPKNTGWVNDFENIFTEKQANILDSLLASYEKNTTVEIAVITIPINAIDKEKFDDFVLQISNSWGVGKKDKNNGILIGISKGHQMIRISNGIGIEKLLTDFKTKQIIDLKFIPNFKKNDFYEGTFQGIEEIIKTLDQKPKYDFINLNEYTVYQFIELLKIDKEKSKEFNILTVGVQVSENWISKKDIDSLIILINSTESSKCVMQSISSYIPIGDSSTIGGQVMDIIEAYKNKNQYPTALTSCAKTDEKRIEIIKKWWDEQKK